MKASGTSRLTSGAFASLNWVFFVVNIVLSFFTTEGTEFTEKAQTQQVGAWGKLTCSWCGQHKGEGRRAKSVERRAKGSVESRALSWIASNLDEHLSYFDAFGQIELQQFFCHTTDGSLSIDASMDVLKVVSPVIQPWIKQRGE